MNVISALSSQDRGRMSDAESRSEKLSFLPGTLLSIMAKSQFLCKTGTNVCIRDPGRRVSVVVTLGALHRSALHSQSTHLPITPRVGFCRLKAAPFYGELP